MVLDASVIKHDYGTLDDISISAVDTSATTTTSVAAGGRMKTQDCVHQRQPLLSSPNMSHVLSIDDSEDENDGLRNKVIPYKLPTPYKDVSRFPKEIWKTFIAFMIMAVGMILNTAVLSIVHERVPNIEVASRNVSKPLPDIILDNIPYNDTWALNVSEIIIMLSVNSCFLLVFFHKHRFIVGRRIFLIMGWLYILRCLTIFVTVLPVASYTYQCSPKSPHPTTWLYIKRTWQLFIGFGLTINGKHTYCGDYMYSGHTVILVMAYLIIREYSPKKCFILHWISCCASLFGVICVLYARAHYTIDIIIAYYITTRVFWIYHTLANNNLKEEHNYLARVCWFPIFRFFEQNIKGPVPREYNWPLPWPRRKHPNRSS